MQAVVSIVSVVNAVSRFEWNCIDDDTYCLLITIAMAPMEKILISHRMVRLHLPGIT
jgi:hypothetical protein